MPRRTGGYARAGGMLFPGTRDRPRHRKTPDCSNLSSSRRKSVSGKSTFRRFCSWKRSAVIAACTWTFTLAEITPKLQSGAFLRVHRSYIVNIDRIDAFIGNTLCIGQHRIPVSKQHRSEVMRKFNILGSAR